MTAMLAGAATVGGAASGCQQGEIVSGVTDSTFVAAMAELRRVESAPATDSASRAAARAAVLQRQGLTPATLERAARALADDPERATAVWRAVERAAVAPLPLPAPAAKGRPANGAAPAPPSPTP